MFHRLVERAFFMPAFFTPAVFMLIASLPNVRADEGMWLFTNPPREHLKKHYDFEPSDEWLTHLQHASVRFNSGGSGSFVSPNGLVMTNHHVGADALHKFSNAEHDYIEEGFYAAAPEDEKKCVDLELNVLVSIEDVTERVNRAVAGRAAGEARLARQAEMNTIEKESFEKTGLRSDVVTLYQGGQFHLYRYKKYTDVRLVFAPEKSIAFFGGDPDNFEFPRYDLDICFFRAYEDGKPAKVEHFLTWSAAGADDGELVFVSGHPGRTNRLNTVSHLKFLRDRAMPLSLNVLRRREVMLRNYAERSHENSRQAQDDLFGYQNSRKARLGGMAGLQDPAIIGGKQVAEKKLRIAVAANADYQKEYGGAWQEVDDALETWADIYDNWYLLEGDPRGGAQAFNCELFRVARMIVRLTAEVEKPNADRLREYAEAGLDSLKQQLYSAAPIYNALEIAKLADSLGMYMEMIGADDPFVRKVLDSKSPVGRATELVERTNLGDVEVRRKLVEGGRAAVEASDDPMIKLAQRVDDTARRLRKKYDEQVQEPLQQAYGKLAKAQFAIYGGNNYPDATFTLRLAFGTVRGYEERGEQVPPWTTMDGAFGHAREHGDVPPFQLPERWFQKRKSVRGETPFNFVCTADIIGGNSGSPVVNRRGELVGIIFDGNMYSLVLDFVYTDKQARAVSVHSAAILEALKKIYDARRVVDELTRE